MKNNSPKISFMIVALLFVTTALMIFSVKILIYKDGCDGEVVVVPKLKYKDGMVFDRGVDRVCVK